MTRSFPRKLAAFSVMAVLALAGCEDDDDETETASAGDAGQGETAQRTEMARIEAGIMTQCMQSGELTAAECMALVPEVTEDLDDMPTYPGRVGCELEFGPGACRETGTGVFMPMMAGFIAAEIIDEIGDTMEARRKRRSPTMSTSGPRPGAAPSRSAKPGMTTAKRPVSGTSSGKPDTSSGTDFLTGNRTVKTAPDGAGQKTRSVTTGAPKASSAKTDDFLTSERTVKTAPAAKAKPKATKRPSLTKSKPSIAKPKKKRSSTFGSGRKSRSGGFGSTRKRRY